MNAVVLCIVFVTVTWAFPRSQDEVQMENSYVEPSFEGFSMDIDSRIINGREAGPHSIPYQAYLIVSSQTGGTRQLCGGSLISPRHLLTAAHCLKNGRSAQVLLGAHNIQKPEPNKILVMTQNLIPHERYNPNAISDDIGIVVFDEPVQLNEYIDTIALPSRTYTTTYEGVNARVSGWGRVDGNGPTSSVLLEANSTVMTNTNCRRYFTNFINSQLCISGSDGIGSCRGDSGGPLVYQNVQIGIVSYGAKGCAYGYPSVFTRITSYMDWIEEKTGLKF